MLQNLLPFETKKISHDITADYELNHLSSQDIDFASAVLDACRIKISHLYDKLSSLSNSRTRLLPHQIEATHKVVNAIRPRFLLADEVGLGKTIEAGLIIKELMFRKGYSRILICTPATLTVQWQQEMISKFNEEFVILNRKTAASIFANPAKFPRIITSIDFIKHEKYGNRLLNSKWDVAVFDEAHRLRRDYSKITAAYSFAEAVADRVDAMLLLSATPFRGKLEELYYLIRLIDPHLLGPHSSFLTEYVIPSRNGDSFPDLKTKIQKVLLRRRKVEVGGFTRRFARTVRFDLTPEERAFYDQTTEYVKREYNLAMQEKNRAVGFVMIVFQKLLDSSTRALLRALEKRKTMLEYRLHGPVSSMNGHNNPTSAGYNLEFETNVDTLKPGREMGPLSPMEWDDFDIDDCDLPEDTDQAGLDNQKSLKDLRKEILTLNHLIRLGRSVRIDKKLQKLQDTINKLKQEGFKKFLIFTQFRTTQDYLYENLSRYRVALFHGSLNVQQKEDAIEDFRGDAEILICTEAGGEGRNLQFANVLFNYDLPWSPLKIEQRIGRLHRFGQPSDVYIFNFATRDTVSERILAVLENKIRLFEESIGPSDLLLGAVEDDFNFQGKLMEFISGRKSKEDFDRELDSSIKIADQGYSLLTDLVTPQCVDFNLDDYYNYTQKNRKIENEEIENIVLSYLSRSGQGRFMLTPEEGHYRITDNEKASEKQATFSSEVALQSDNYDFLAVGHPLVDDAIAFFLGHPGKRTFISFRVPEMPAGYYFVFLCHYENGLSRTELMSCFVPVDDFQKAWIPEDIQIPVACRPDHSQIVSDNIQPYDMRKNIDLFEAYESALSLIKKESDIRGVELRDELHSIFKKEEYKLEISFGKKIRQLEEKKDIQKMKYRMKPDSQNKSRLTRVENELVKTRQELQLSLEKIRRESTVTSKQSMLQAYAINITDVSTILE